MALRGKALETAASAPRIPASAARRGKHDELVAADAGRDRPLGNCSRRRSATARSSWSPAS